MNLYVRKGRAFKEVSTTGDVLEVGVWCDGEGTYQSDLDERTADDPCMYSQSIADPVCKTTGPHKHWDHYGYECLSSHTPVAIVEIPTGKE